MSETFIRFSIVAPIATTAALPDIDSSAISADAAGLEGHTVEVK